MLSRVRLDFACNDPDNGDFAGRVERACYHLTQRHESVDLESPGLREIKFTVLDDPHRIRIHRREFIFIDRTPWFGNWCWDSFTFSRPEAKRLLATLREKGWDADNVPAVWADRFWERGRAVPPPKDTPYEERER